MSTLRDDGGGDRAAAERPSKRAHPRLEDFGGVAAAVNGLGVQYRQAFRVGMALPVEVTAPIQLRCETVDLSVLGVKFNRELLCAAGTIVSFTIEAPGRVTAKPAVIELRAEVVRVQRGDSGLRFVAQTPDQRRSVRALVHAQQPLLVVHRTLRQRLSGRGAP